MNDNNLQEVYFHEYCIKCKHVDKRAWDDPCNDCLACPMNEGSHKPIYFEDKEK